MIFIHSISLAQIQCPEGANLVTVPMQIGPCTYDIDFCVTCQTGVTPSNFEIMEVRKRNIPQCIQTLNAQQIIDGILSQASNYQFIYLYFCSQIYVPPCSEGHSDFITTTTALCWKIECRTYFGETTTVYSPCDGAAKCIVTFAFCWSPDPPPSGSYVKVYDGPPPIHKSGSTCTKEWWEVTIPTIPGTSTDCFIYRTYCNP